MASDRTHSAEAGEFPDGAVEAITPPSGTSLVRRSRTRTRSRTVTQPPPSQRRGKSAGPSTSRSKNFWDADVPLPGRVGALSVTTMVGSVGERTRTPTSAFQVTPTDATPRKRCQSLSRKLASKPDSSSGSSSQPSPSTPIPIPGTSPMVSSASKGDIRNSIISQHSTASSSVYPASTISRSGSMSTTRFFSDDDDVLDSRLREFSSSFDVDDVSERLRLLVTNSYFLPPAHSKPALSRLAVSVPKTPTKTTSPGFLDIFRLGKSKSKLTTPENEPDLPVAPVLRTTSDSTTASGWFPPQGYSRSAPPTPTPHEYIRQTRESNRAPRVVVVRERMDNLALAAKEAEEVLNTRIDNNAAPSFIDDVVDPTDAVDVPHRDPTIAGLTVGDSMDAAELVDALVPPATSPGLWSLDSQEEKWRKAILHQAVGHSLNSSSMSSSAGVSVSPTSPVSPGWSNLTKSVKNKVGRPIIDQSLFERDEDERAKSLGPSTSESRPTTFRTGQAGRTFIGPPISSTSRVLLQAPGRIETSPLPPPPRRPLVNPIYSLSQVDLSAGAPEEAQDKARIVRKSMSSPVLGDMHEHGVNTRTFVLTPPPLVRPSRRAAVSPALPEDAENRGPSPQTDEARYSDEKPPSARYATPVDYDEMLPRPSVSTEGRPSMSEYSQLSPSPTASAFQDALFDARSSSSSIPRISIGSVEHNLYRDIPRHSESSTSRRPSPLRHQAITTRSPTYPMPTSSSRPYDYESSESIPTSASPTTTMQPILVPPPASPTFPDLVSPLPTTPPLPDFSTSPGTPPAPLPERRSKMPPGPLAVNIPSRRVEHPIHTAPVPASPIAFFDSIEEQSIVLDALDSSDEEEDNTAQLINDTQSAQIYMDTRTNASTSAFSISSSQPSISRHGNFSTPYLTPSQASVRSLPVSTTPSFDRERNKPVSNVPPRGTFFSGRKGKGVGPVSALDFENYDKRQSIGSESIASICKSDIKRPGTAGSGAASVESHASAGHRDASLEIFEGMLTKHLQTERDVMKRIANNVSSRQGRRRES